MIRKIIRSKFGLVSVFIIIFFIVIPLFAFPISDTQLFHDPYGVLLANEFDFNDYTILDTKRAEGSIIFLIYNNANKETLYLQAEKYYFFPRYRLILYPQLIQENAAIQLNDLLYEMEISRNNMGLSVKSTLAPSIQTYMAGVMIAAISIHFIKAVSQFTKHRKKQS